MSLKRETATVHTGPQGVCFAAEAGLSRPKTGLGTESILKQPKVVDPIIYRLGAMDVTNPYEFIRNLKMDSTGDNVLYFMFSRFATAAHCRC